MLSREIDSISRLIGGLGIYQRTTFLIFDRVQALFTSVEGGTSSQLSEPELIVFLDEFEKEISVWVGWGAIMCLAHEDDIFEKLQSYLEKTDEMTTRCDPTTITTPDRTVARLTIFREQSEAYALFSAVLHTRKDELTSLRGDDADAMMNLLHRKSHQFPHGDELRNLCWSRLLEIAIASRRLPTALDLKEITDCSTYPVGRGGFGDVYSGNLAGQKVAIKVTRAYGDLDVVHRRLCREILIWSQLSHPHVLRFIGISYKFPPYPAIVSPFMKNGDILSYIKLHPNADTTELLRQVASALNYLHGFNPTILHRDLRSPNILMDDAHKTVLTDFGISSITDKSIKNIMTTVQHGNVRWNSPELMFEDGAEPSCGSDIWAFGMVAVEVLTKDIPFQNIIADGAVLLHIHKGNRPRRPDGTDETLWNLITKCWHDIPAQRISATQMESGLRALLQSRKAPPKKTKVPQPPTNLRNRGIGKVTDYKVGYGVIEISMLRRSLDYIRASDEKILAKFEENLGVTFALPDSTTAASDPDENISVEVTGFPWCTEQVYLEFSKLLELRRLAGGVTWTAGPSSEIRFKVKQEAERPRDRHQHDEERAFSDGDRRSRRSSYVKYPAVLHERTDRKASAVEYVASAPPAHRPEQSYVPPPPPRPISYVPSPPQPQSTFSQPPPVSYPEGVYPPSAPGFPPGFISQATPYVTPGWTAYGSPYGGYPQQLNPYTSYSGYDQGISPYRYSVSPYESHPSQAYPSMSVIPPPTTFIPPAPSPPRSPVRESSHYPEHRHRSSTRHRRPTEIHHYHDRAQTPSPVPSVRSVTPPRGHQPSRVQLPKGYRPWLDDDLEIIPTHERSPSRTVSDPPTDTERVRRRSRSRSRTRKPLDYGGFPPTTIVVHRSRSSSRAPRSRSPRRHYQPPVVVVPPSRPRSYSRSPPRIVHVPSRSRSRSRDSYNDNYRRRRRRSRSYERPQPVIVMPPTQPYPPRVNFNANDQYIPYSGPSSTEPPKVSTSKKFRQRISNIFKKSKTPASRY